MTNNSSKPESIPDDARRFLTTLLDRLAETDLAAQDALLRANPDLVDQYAASDNLRGAVRAALSSGTARPLSLDQRRVIERTRAESAECDHKAGPTAPDGAESEPPGILTTVTRKVPPERAIELYRKIAPVFVYQLLNRLNQSASLRVVNQLVEHLCSAEAQSRLRESPHVRDGILEELRMVLGHSEIEQNVSREDLLRLLKESGAMNDLIAMENCIKLAATTAG